jgi:capsular polysaccharide transport system permease protein
VKDERPANATVTPLRPRPPVPEGQPQRPPAGRARLRGRHLGAALAFLLVVVVPVAGAAWYLWGVAHDQYASHLAFSVRRDEAPQPAELLGGIAGLAASGGASDAAILHDYIRSQPLVQRIDARLDLRALYAAPDDPVFGLAPDAGIEAVADHWRRMVRASHDGATGLIEVQVQAFRPEDARDIALAILDESSDMINRLSAVARADATRHAADDLERAETRLAEARQALMRFRAANRIVDPESDMRARTAILATLEAELAQTGIELDLLAETTREGDPRIAQAQRRTRALEVRIAAERDRFGGGAPGSGGDGAFARLMGEFEGLSVDVEFAERAYLAARARYDAAASQAERQSRYLAAHVGPTLAETPEYPRRMVLLAMLAAGLTLAWAIVVLFGYGIRDRR